MSEDRREQRIAWVGIGLMLAAMLIAYLVGRWL